MASFNQEVNNGLNFTTNFSGVNMSMNMTNISVDISQALGPRRKDVFTILVLNVLYIGIFASGLVGNLCTCIVIARNAFMWCDTNYYLFSLAVSDLLIIVLGKFIIIIIIKVR